MQAFVNLLLRPLLLPFIVLIERRALPVAVSRPAARARVPSAR